MHPWRYSTTRTVHMEVHYSSRNDSASTIRREQVYSQPCYYTVLYLWLLPARAQRDSFDSPTEVLMPADARRATRKNALRMVVRGLGATEHPRDCRYLSQEEELLYCCVVFVKLCSFCATAAGETEQWRAWEDRIDHPPMWTVDGWDNNCQIRWGKC